MNNAQIWYNSDKAKHIFVLCYDVVRYVKSVVNDFAGKYRFSVKVGLFIKEELGDYEDEPAIMWFDDPGIRISSLVIEWWSIDQKSTKYALRYLLAHELAHYLFWFVQSDGQTCRFDAADEEHEADKVAENYTGLSRAEAEGIIDHIWDQSSANVLANKQASSYNKTLYHTTTLSLYTQVVVRTGLMPQQLRQDIAGFVEFDRGLYLANNIVDVRDIAKRYSESTHEKYAILKISARPGIKLIVDPEIGEPDAPWFITPETIFPRQIKLVEVV